MKFWENQAHSRQQDKSPEQKRSPRYFHGHRLSKQAHARTCCKDGSKTLASILRILLRESICRTIIIDIIKQPKYYPLTQTMSLDRPSHWVAESTNISMYTTIYIFSIHDEARNIGTQYIHCTPIFVWEY